MSRRGAVRALSAALGLALLAGCAAPAPTAYQRQSESRYGYTERRGAGEDWTVAFTANSLTPREDVEALALRRAAELARERGKPRFAVMDRVYEIRTDRTYAYPTGSGTDPRDFHRYAGSPYADPFGNTRFTTVEARTAKLTIRPFAGTAPDGAIRVYDAADVLAKPLAAPAPAKK